MLLTTLVLISVDCEHDCLKEGIDFGHCDEATKMGDMAGFGLQQEEEIAIFLCLFVIWEEAFL